ncbi:hypothetical protein [Pseudomonas sp. 22 E 5]|nr:hypothetical protein [Pseudomonas sp. 22 E 5]
MPSGSKDQRWETHNKQPTMRPPTVTSGQTSLMAA